MKDNLPDKDGFFGEYGGKFVPETLMYALNELEQTYKTLKDNNGHFKMIISKYHSFRTTEPSNEGLKFKICWGNPLKI